jgi:protein-histidine pros-kinase
MGLSVRINLVVGMGMLLAFVGLALLCSDLLDSQARRGLSREAELMLDSAVATRAYTTAEILPLLSAPSQHEFLPQSIPFYAATQDFLRLREQHPEYSYKEAALNPTNPRDRAMDWEADLIQQFRNDPKSKELKGERDTPMGRTLYLARPIQVSPECMECHSEPDRAPKALLQRYGSNNGFGWQANEVVGAQVVSVPVSASIDDAHHTLLKLLTAIGIALGALWLLVAYLVQRWIVAPFQKIAALAESASRGEPGAQFPKAPSPEFGMLVKAFERMRTSLEKAMTLLGH